MSDAVWSTSLAHAYLDEVGAQEAGEAHSCSCDRCRRVQLSGYGQRQRDSHAARDQSASQLCSSMHSQMRNKASTQ